MTLFFEILVSWIGYTFKSGARLINKISHSIEVCIFFKRRWDTVSTIPLNIGLLFGYIFENTAYSWALILLLFDH